MHFTPKKETNDNCCPALVSFLTLWILKITHNYSISNAVYCVQRLREGAEVLPPREEMNVPERVIYNHTKHNHSIMKKTIIALVALVGVSFAQGDITLRYLLDFNGPGGSENAAVNGGSTGITTLQFINYTDEGLAMDGSYAGKTTRKEWSITSSAGLNDGTTDGVLNTTDGFTLMFNGYADSASWKSFLSFTISNTVGETTTNTPYKFEMKGTASELGVYTNPDAGCLATLDGLKRDTWYNYAVSVSGSTYTFAAIDTTGQLVSSYTMTGATGKLTGIYHISSYDDHKTSGYMIDNVAVYDGAMDFSAMSVITREQVAGNGTPNVVPEPTTATLSLVALAGLAVRRRRK